MKSFLRCLVVFTLTCCSCAFTVSAMSDGRSNPAFLDIKRNAVGLQADDLEKLLRAAAKLYKERKYDEALKKCIKAAQIKPNDFRPRFLAGVVYMAQRKLKSASKQFDIAISLKPKDKRLYLLKAHVDQMRGAKDEALRACREALKIDPTFAAAYAMIGDTLRNSKDRQDEAIAAYRSAIAINPGNLSVYTRLGQLLAYSNDEKGAEEILRKSMAADPSHMAGRFELGRLWVKQGRLKEARELWERRTSDSDRTFPNFITLLERAENLQRATETLEQSPDDPNALLRMGYAVMDGDSWVVNGRQERAIVYFRKALELRPDFARAQFAICKAYVQLADTYKDKNKNVDEELAKLRRFDPKLAEEIEEYRKNYSGGLTGISVDLNQ